jgi:hypothetical protein
MHYSWLRVALENQCLWLFAGALGELFNVRFAPIADIRINASWDGKFDANGQLSGLAKGAGKEPPHLGQDIVLQGLLLARRAGDLAQARLAGR